MRRRHTNVMLHTSQAVAQRRPLDDLFTLAYQELRRMASAIKRSDQAATLTPTVLVHEAWLKLMTSPQLAQADRVRFKQIAGHAMREVLIEAARRRHAQKRGGGPQFTIAFDDAVQYPAVDEQAVLALDEALDDLARISPRQAQLVEGRFFGGLSVTELAELLEVSQATVVRDWRTAKAWLAHQLQR